jgi:CRISPR-associated protein Cmr1
MMQSITFECEVITPMFLAGADGTTPELRPPSIKGALRFWWRALNGHLPLGELKRMEGEIFGDTSKQSQFSMIVIPKKMELGKEKSVLHKPYIFPCILPKSTFEVRFIIPNENKYWNIEKCSHLFQLVTILGGFGKRVRRGMGSVNIVDCSDKSWKKRENSLEHILSLVNTFSNHYMIKNNSIYINFSGGMQYFPWVRQIEMGEHNPNILQDISNNTHGFHSGYKQEIYEASLGHANRGRFASPIYVSVVKGSIKPVITTLNPIPDRSGRDISSRLQDEFKDRILNP